MTIVIENAAPAEVHRAPRRGRTRPAKPSSSVLALVVLSILLATALAGYASRVANAQPAASYPVASQSAAWVQAAVPAVATSFRSTPVLASVPVSATVWLDARDSYRMWINGRVVATNRMAARAGARPVAMALDVRSHLRAGPNVLAVEVEGLGEKNAALWLRLDVQLADGKTVHLGTGTNSWLATSNAALTGKVLAGQPEYIQAGFPATGWAAPHAIAALRAITAPVPAEVVATPSTAGALNTVAVAGFDGVYRLVIDAPVGTNDSWLRVAATGALSISVDGRVISSQQSPAYVSPNSHRPAPLWLIHLGHALRAGSNVVVFRVTGAQRTALATDAFVRVGGSWSAVASDKQRWTVKTGGASRAVTTSNAALAKTTWPNGFINTSTPESTSATPWRAMVLGALLGLLASLALLGLAASRSGAGADWSERGHILLGRFVLALAPGAAVIATALAVGRWITLAPGFPYRHSVVVLAVAASLAVPVGLAVPALLRRLSPPTGSAPARESAAPPHPAAVPAPVASPWARAWEVTFARWSWATPSRVAVLVLALLSTASQSWRLDRQPIWQDEATSITVARAIGSHGLPRLDSGLYYFKGELYHSLLALVLTVTDSTTALRAVSLLWFAATVVAFGCLLMPTLTNRPGVIIAATALLVSVPAELTWARDVRMYQQMQFFVVVFIGLYIRALRDGRRRDIVFSAISLLAMYLSHEESFILLPALPLAALLVHHKVWANRRTYLFAYGPVFVVIAIQYLVSRIHPVDFGDDLSSRPYVGWDPHQADFYYQRVFFGPMQQASMALLSTLALIGIVFAARRRERAAMLLGLTLVVTIATASLIFTAKVDRYSFAVIPMLVALSVLGGAKLADAVMTLCSGRRYLVARPADNPGGTGVIDAGRPAWVRLGTALTVTVLTLATLATLVISPRGFSLLAADVSGSPNPLAHNDYQPTITYLRAHQQPGDQVITLSPPVMTELYLGRRPDRVIQTGRNKLLYLVLRHGRAVDTLLGVPELLTGPELRTYLEAHRRVWLISDTGSYAQGIPPDVRQQVLSDFKVVFQDATTTVSLWDVG